MSWDGSLAIFSENRVLTFLVILKNNTGGSFQIDQTFVDFVVINGKKIYTLSLESFSGPIQ